MAQRTPFQALVCFISAKTDSLSLEQAFLTHVSLLFQYNSYIQATRAALFANWYNLKMFLLVNFLTKAYAVQIYCFHLCMCACD